MDDDHIIIENLDIESQENILKNLDIESKENIILKKLLKELNITRKYSKWNDKIENVIVELYNKSLIYKTQHIKQAEKYYDRYSYFMTSVLIISPLAGSISLIKLILQSNNIFFDISVAILSFLTGIIISFIKYSKYDDVGNSHKTASARYMSLINNIKRQLLLYRKDRISADEYLQWLTNSFDNLFISSPLLHLNNILDNDKLTINDKDEDNKNDLILKKCKNENENESESDDEEIKNDEKNEYKNVRIENDIESLLPTPDNIYNDGMMTYQLNRLMKQI